MIPSHDWLLCIKYIRITGYGVLECYQNGVRETTVYVSLTHCAFCDASPLLPSISYLKKDKLLHPPPLMEGEAIASRILEMGPAQAKFLG